MQIIIFSTQISSLALLALVRDAVQLLNSKEISWKLSIDNTQRQKVFIGNKKLELAPIEVIFVENDISRLKAELTKDSTVLCVGERPVQLKTVCPDLTTIRDSSSDMMNYLLKQVSRQVNQTRQAAQQVPGEGREKISTRQALLAQEEKALCELRINHQIQTLDGLMEQFEAETPTKGRDGYQTFYLADSATVSAKVSKKPSSHHRPALSQVNQPKPLEQLLLHFTQRQLHRLHSEFSLKSHLLTGEISKLRAWAEAQIELDCAVIAKNALSFSLSRYAPGTLEHTNTSLQMRIQNGAIQELTTKVMTLSPDSWPTQESRNIIIIIHKAMVLGFLVNILKTPQQMHRAHLSAEWAKQVQGRRDELLRSILYYPFAQRHLPELCEHIHAKATNERQRLCNQLNTLGTLSEPLENTFDFYGMSQTRPPLLWTEYLLATPALQKQPEKAMPLSPDGGDKTQWITPTELLSAIINPSNPVFNVLHEKRGLFESTVIKGFKRCYEIRVLKKGSERDLGPEFEAVPEPNAFLEGFRKAADKGMYIRLNHGSLKQTDAFFSAIHTLLQQLLNNEKQRYTNKITHEPWAKKHVPGISLDQQKLDLLDNLLQTVINLKNINTLEALLTHKLLNPADPNYCAFWQRNNPRDVAHPVPAIIAHFMELQSAIHDPQKIHCNHAGEITFDVKDPIFHTKANTQISRGAQGIFPPVRAMSNAPEGTSHHSSAVSKASNSQGHHK
jgi:hypothetical protein